MAHTVQGKTYTWQLSDAPIGSGDAGEVYAVVCVDQPDLTGVMKKPARIATSGTIQRQAGQIAQEGLALARLDGLPQGKTHPPRLLDQAPDFTQGTANYFIVSETAPGEDMSSMLAQSRQTDKPFPRRVIITVLDSLFDLFARAHHAGVLWNDVKLDHIYWHNPTGQVAVIDWGNALFLDGDTNGGRRSLPRWEDYRQMVDTLGGFLQQSAPELYADLGWDEFHGQELDSLHVSILARRIAYQQQVVALRVMEYQSLIRVVLSTDPTLEGLQKIHSYQQILEQIGAPWDADAVLDYGRSLVQTALADGDTQTSIRTTALMWELFDPSLDLSWHLIREYLRNPDILSHESLAELAKNTLNENWSSALWTLITIARDLQTMDWWDQLIPVLRQKALGLVTPPPYQTCQSLLAWAEAQGQAKAGQTKALSSILENWRHKGENLEESPFDYALLDLLRGEPNLPHRLRSEFKGSFAAGEVAIRELMQVWVNMTWDVLPKAFRRVAGWDPDRWGVIRLAETADSFHSWLGQLYDGPEGENDIHAFLNRMLADRPPVDRLLGKPPWLKTLKNMLDAISNGSPITNYRAEVQTWCPWLLNYPDIHSPSSETLKTDAASIHSVLSHFAQHLKTWSDVNAGLEAVRAKAPEHHPYCKRLADGFQNVFSLNADLSSIETVCAAPVQPVLTDSCEVLQALVSWRKSIAEKNRGSTLEIINEIPYEDWRILEHARKETALWIDEITPLLRAIMALEPCSEIGETENNQPYLSTIAKTCFNLRQSWAQIYDTGPHQRLMETLEETIEQARASFFEWRRAIEHSGDRVERLLYHSHLGLIRQISDMLLRLSQHSRQARLSFATLGQGDEVTLTTQIQAAENILDHLSAMESILVSETGDRRFPAWQEAFQKINEAKTNEKRREMALTLSDDHPLYAWLVQSVLAQ